MELILRDQKKYISSLELLEEINFFRKQEGNRTKLKHNDLLKIIRDEFGEEIAEGNISLGSYKDKQNQLRPMFELTISQAKQVLVRESKVVRKAVIKKLEEIENATVGTSNSDNLLQATKNLLELSSELNDRVKSLEDKTNCITRSERYRLQQAIKKRVYERANHLNMNDNLKLLFANFYRDFKRKFSIAILDDLAPMDLESAFEFVNSWREEKNLKRM
ncbi:ORF6C domain-containing protein [Cetobacterium sp.]|uniref:ORF6C domain-containing protein n=1 Tax=Cetobacterium sp. TaxID=2071632 RepID=UPI003EE7A57E